MTLHHSVITHTPQPSMSEFTRRLFESASQATHQAAVRFAQVKASEQLPPVPSTSLPPKPLK